MRAYKMTHIDPRNASRVPSASREIAAHLRYDNPVNACELMMLAPKVSGEHLMTSLWIELHQIEVCN